MDFHKKLQQRFLNGFIQQILIKGEPPKIDGILDDASWDSVEWATNFIENRPDENTPPTEQTKFKIMYDAKFLYVAVRAIDAKILIKL